MRKVVLGVVVIIGLGAIAAFAFGRDAVSDLAAEKFAETQLGYDVDVIYDENGDRQLRPVDGPVAWEVDFDPAKLDGLPTPDGYVFTEDSADERGGSIRVQLISESEDDVEAAANEFEALLRDADWSVEREPVETGKIRLTFERGTAKGSALILIESTFGTVSISLTYTPDVNALPWLTLTIPEPSSVVEQNVEPPEWTFTVEATDLESTARSYGDALRSEGWNVESVSNEGGRWQVQFSAEGQLGAVQVLAEDEGRAIVLVRVLRNG